MPRPDLPAVKAGLVAVEPGAGPAAGPVRAGAARHRAPGLPALARHDADRGRGCARRAAAEAHGDLRPGPDRRQGPLDILQGLLVSCCLANAVALCHLDNLVPATLDADSDGRQELARRALVVATDLRGPMGGGELPQTFAERLRVEPEQVVRVPFDQALQSPHWELRRLRPATTGGVPAAGRTDDAGRLTPTARFEYFAPLSECLVALGGRGVHPRRPAGLRSPS